MSDQEKERGNRMGNGNGREGPSINLTQGLNRPWPPMPWCNNFLPLCCVGTIFIRLELSPRPNSNTFIIHVDCLVRLGTH